MLNMMGQSMGAGVPIISRARMLDMMGQSMGGVPIISSNVRTRDLVQDCFLGTHLFMVFATANDSGVKMASRMGDHLFT